MDALICSDELVGFKATTSPLPADLGRTLEGNAPTGSSLLEMHFGTAVARVPITDLWSACCELLLQAQLVRERLLDHFVLDVERIFDLSYEGERLLCLFSREHVFSVLRDGFAESLERLVDEIFEGTSCPRVMCVGARWGASSIRSQPYYYRFTDSVRA